MRRRFEFGWRRRRNDQDNTDRVGMADCKRDHLRTDARIVHTDRGLRVSLWFLLLDYAHDGSRCRDAQRRRDLYAI
jgi:hypothetical protein